MAAPLPRKRLIAIGCVALALAPGTWLRSDPVAERSGRIAFSALAEIDKPAELGGFIRKGVWQIASPDMDFGGFSALVLLPDNELLAFSDRGFIMRFARPGSAAEGEAAIAPLADRGRFERFLPDIESATRSTANGDVWLGFEAGNIVGRFSAKGRQEAARRPREWRGWPGNSGPEAMARLPDGRFLILPEASRTGVLHPGDPTMDAPARQFAFSVPEDYAPTDMTALPDGRVLVLLRKTVVAFPPFSAALGIADPTDLDQGERLEIRKLVDLDRILPRENYEGLAVEAGEDGAVTLWIISDDNIASFQRTLLAQLSWQPRRKSAPEP
ncbi:MAG: esterase-like activity of phytase family protein [Alteraurantiacibacter sp.]